MNTFVENRQRVTDKSGTLVLLELACPAFTATLRIVNDTDSIESNGETYIGFPFTFKLPDDSSGGNARAQLTIANAGSVLQDELERIGPNEIVMGKMIIIDRSEPDTIAHYWYLPMSNVTCTPEMITAQLGVDYIMRQPACKLKFNPFTTPGLFS